MKNLVVMAAAAATGLVGSVVAVSAAAASPTAPPVGSIAWSPCPDNDPLMGALLKGLECGTLQVPLDYSKPDGKKINVALTRAQHTSPDAQYQGVVLLNRGQWPGAIGRDLPTRYAKGTTGLPTSVGSTYDWIGFDPRGVGASEPALVCDPAYVWAGHALPDPVPQNAAEEKTWIGMAREYAASCGKAYGDELKHLTTKDTARDMDMVRRALGQKQINYFGYDYGTYLGSVYASMFPHRVRRMVLDSVVDPTGIWYKDNQVQNVASEKRAKIYFTWIAKYDAVYHLGTTEAAVEANYYKGMDMLRQAPIDNEIGPNEYSDMIWVDLYRNYGWATHAAAMSAWILHKDPTKLKASFTVPAYPHQNRQAAYSAVECTDTAWPQNWQRWHNDAVRQYNEGNTFLTWKNTWYNAPCAFWPVSAEKPQRIGHNGVNVLLVQPENDAAHSVYGAYATHRLFPNSRLILEVGGNNADAALSANHNDCLNALVSAYFKDGTRPAKGKGVNASCPANPDPVPPATS